jgi:aldehyde:ferredoxin oxidoreductase
MVLKQNYGYTGKILRVNLSSGASSPELLEEALLKKFLGGAALGIKFIFDEVPPGVSWPDPGNRLFIGSGPLTGTRIGGSGSIAVVTKGALTGGMASTQANGFFGAFLKFSGFDAIILEGAAPRWVYLYIHDGNIEIRDAAHLVGKTTFSTESILKEELHKKERETSILCIGPAGENLVKFATIFVDGGHMASHNGVGAVLGSKKLKAIVVDRGEYTPPLKDKEAISRLSKEILDRISADMMGGMTLKEGTVGGVVMGTKSGTCPVKNYTTNIHAIDPVKLEAYTAANIRRKFNAKRTPCWACLSEHSQRLEITEGKYRGRVVDEPEFEGMSAFSSLVGVDDVTTTVVLASEADSLGMDVNESGWVIACVMECYEKRVITGKDTDGLEMAWGNGEAIMAMLNKIARREGFGNVLAEGVMRAAQHIGGEAPKFAVHTQKGNTPRSHDHRVMRFEQFDTSVSNLGTLEAHSAAPMKLLGLPPVYDAFDPEVLPATVAKVKGAMVFEDSLVTCRFQTGSHLDLLCQAVNSATGWDIDIPGAMTIGKRAVNLARLFNLRHGIDAKLDAPSMRYGSAPLDGKAAGRGVMPQWDRMCQIYYENMGWDKTGQPLPETLESLGLADVILK